MSEQQAADSNGYATSGAASNDETDYAQVAIILAGSYCVLNGIHATIRNLYRYACYQSDPRLIILGLREDVRSTRVWGWAARVIETTWLPLWFEHQRVRDLAVNEAVESAYVFDRANRQLRRRSSSGSTSVENNNDYQEEDLQDWREAIDRQRQLERCISKKFLFIIIGGAPMFKNIM